MTASVHHIRASYAFAERNLNLVKRYWAWELVWLVYSITNSLSVSYIGLGMEVLTGSTGNVDAPFLVLYLLIGTLVWRYLSSIFYWVTELIAIERWEGTIEYTLMAPVPRIVHVIGHTGFAMVYSLVFTGVILAATTLLFDLNLAQANLIGGALVLVAGTFSFVGIGMLGAVLPPALPRARRADDSHHHRHAAAGLRRLLPDRSAAPHLPGDGRCLAGNVHPQRRAGRAARRRRHPGAMAIHLARPATGAGYGARRPVGVQRRRALRQAQRPAGAKRLSE
jgi:hypothetical protein